MTRTLLTLVVASLVLVAGAVTPAAAAFGGSSAADTVEPVRYGGDGHPSFIVTLSDDADAADSLEDWTDAADGRELIELDNESNRAVVAAPAVEMMGASLQIDWETFDVAYFGGTKLADRGYVEDVYLNYRMSNTEPLEALDNASDIETPQVGITSIDDPDRPTDGMAFDADANRTTMAESREILGVDNVSAKGDGVTVAVVDTGVNTASGRLLGNGSTESTPRIDNASKSMITGESVNTSAGNFSAIEDGNGHGTWVASSIAADANGTVHDGVAPNATVLALKALDDDGSGATADIAEAVRYAADNDADVISMSLGSPIYSEALADAVDYAYAHGVSAVVVAVGNSRQTTHFVASPADVDGVIGVGATNGSEPGQASSAYFSQVSGQTVADGSLDGDQNVDVAAPGMQTVARVASTDGALSNSTLSGTSMATPMVAGSVALALDANPSLVNDSDAVSKRVEDTARPVPNAGTTEVGAGMTAADNLVDGTEPETDQSDARTDPAEQRDEFYGALADSSGGFIAGLRERV